MFFLNKKTFKLLYEKPHFKILESFATPPGESGSKKIWSKIALAISNPSNFENTICSFELKSGCSFRFSKICEQGEINIPLPKVSKVNAEIDLDYAAVKNLRGCQAVLTIIDLKGRKSSKRFKFMPSYNRRKVKKAIKEIEKNS